MDENAATQIKTLDRRNAECLLYFSYWLFLRGPALKNRSNLFLLAGVAAIGVGVWLWSWWPVSGSVRYEVTATVEIEGKLYNGSAIQEVIFREFPGFTIWGDNPRFYEDRIGTAVRIETLDGLIYLPMLDHVFLPFDICNISTTKLGFRGALQAVQSFQTCSRSDVSSMSLIEQDSSGSLIMNNGENPTDPVLISINISRSNSNFEFTNFIKLLPSNKSVDMMSGYCDVSELSRACFIKEEYK